MFCRNCGTEIDDKAVVCPNCGVEQKAKNDYNKYIIPALYGLLGFFFPAAGITLFLVWNENEEKQVESKSAAVGTLVSFIVSSIMFLAAFIRRRYLF